MIAKISTVLFALFLLLNVTFQHCEAVGFDGAKDTGETTLISSLTDNANIHVTGDKMDSIRGLLSPRLSSHKNPEKPFFHVLLATLSINVVCMVGLLSLIPILLKTRWNFYKSFFWVANSHVQLHPDVAKQLDNFGMSKTKGEVDKFTKEKMSAKQLVDLFVPAFTCGTILSTTLFLVMPEAIVFIQRGTSTEEGEIEILSETIARFGVSVMAGFLLPLLIAGLFPRSAEYIIDHSLVATDSFIKYKSVSKKVLKGEIIVEGDEEEKVGEDTEESLQSTKVSFDTISENYTNEGESSSRGDTDPNFNDHPKKLMTQKEVNYRVASIIFIGNFTQNLIDGFFVGVAFMTCSYATAICVTIITAYIKINQEVADYFLLTQSANISIPRALLFIFAAGVALVIGSLSIITFDLDELTIGVFLSLTAGVYLQKSAGECLPRVNSVVRISKDRYFSLIFFLLGAIPIGISLVGDRHCHE